MIQSVLVSLNRITRNSLRAGLIALIGLAAIFFLRSADGIFLADTEIWALHLTGELFKSTHETSVYYKPLFHLVLYPIQALDISSSWMFLLARWLFALIGLGTVYLTYQVTYKLSSSRLAAGFAALLLLTNTVFLTRGFRIRSDFLASFFHLATMLLMLTVARKAPEEQRRFTAAVGILVSLMLLSTPKAVYFFISQTVFFFSWGLSGAQLKRKSFLFEMIKGHAIPVVLGLILIAITGFASVTFSQLPLSQAYRHAWEFFIQVTQSSDTPSYWSPQAFQYVRRLIAENPIWTVLVYFSFLTAIFSHWRARRHGNANWSLEKSFYLSAFVTLAFMLLHNHRVPFFIASMLPPVCVTSGLFLSRWLQNWRRASTNRSWKNPVLRLLMRQRAGVARATVLLVAIFVVGKAYRAHEIQLSENNNRKQLHAIKLFDEYLKRHPSAQFYDMVGSLPAKSDIFAFVGPGEKVRFSLLQEKLNIADPDLFLFSNRLLILEPFITDRFLSWMVPIGHGVYARGLRLPIVAMPKSMIPNKDQEVHEVSWSYLQLLMSLKGGPEELSQAPLQIEPNGDWPETQTPSPHIWIQWKTGAVTPWIPFLNAEQQGQIRAVLVDPKVKSLMVTRFEPLRLPFTNSYMDLFRFDSNY